MPDIIPGGGNWQTEVTRLRRSGYALPNNPVMARIEAKKVADTVGSRNLSEVANRKLAADMNRQKAGSTRAFTAGMTRTGSDLQMALPKVRQPLSSLMDKGIPFNINDPKELIELRRWCNTSDAPVWMADYTFKPIGDIKPGDKVIGWETEDWASVRKHKATKIETVYSRRRRTLTPTTVMTVNKRIAPEVVKITFASGRTVKCTPDHEWLRYHTPKDTGSEYAPLQLGSVARSVVRPTTPLNDPEKIAAANYLAGMVDGDGTWRQRSIRIYQSVKNAAVVDKIDWAFETLGFTYTRHVRTWNHDLTSKGKTDMVIWELCRGHGGVSSSQKNRQQMVDFYNWAHPAKFDHQHMDVAWLTSNFGDPDEVISIESLGPGEVVSMQTTTGNYTAWGYASKNCRLFYSTHDLVPLLIDLYSRFPVIGLSFPCKDYAIEKFYTEMFLDTLSYEEFLPDSLLREYWICGEVTSLGHFDETIGIWSSEEILNPDMVAVSKSMFVPEERVQLLVKDLVESLRDGPGNQLGMDERPSEKLQRSHEFSQLSKHYPEMLSAASRDDGLDLSDALVSRLVNRASPWDDRGTPILLRSFRSLLMEESLNAAQDAVADRMYSPLILATMGIENMGDGEPWIPSQEELENLRNDMQSALAADFKLMVHNFGVNMQSILGRESVPNFDSDYDRVDAKLMQAWGVGQALVMGGNSAGGAYASSALNREVCEQLMRGIQNKVKRHIRKRMEVVAEAQEHYDYDRKGGLRVPIYREVVEEDAETGEQRIVRVPKLLLPDIRFSSLNLRDESTERAFIMELKQMGVPISDRQLALNVDVDFDQNLEREEEETISKGIAKARTFKRMQEMCDAESLPYPPELAAHLEATLQLREMLSQTKMVEDQEKMMKEQSSAASPAGQAGALPPEGAAEQQGQPMMPMSEAMQIAGIFPEDALAVGQDQDGADVSAPMMSGPGGVSMMDPSMMQREQDVIAELPRNRTRPVESDEMRQGAPHMAKRGKRKGTAATRWAQRVHGKISDGPSSVGHRLRTDEQSVVRAIERRNLLAKHSTSPLVSNLVKDPAFYKVLNMQGYQNQIQSDYPEVRAGGAKDSEKLLHEMIEQYEDATGAVPIWD